MPSGLDRLFASAPDPARTGWLKGVAYAHRGLHGPGAVENSLTAFAAAVDAGLGIECDVQETADGQAVVFHDATLDRMTDRTGPVVELAAAALARIALRGSRDAIPRLSALLSMIGGRVPLLVEIKALRGRSADPLCRAVWRDLASYRGPVAVMGFDPRVGSWFRRHAPDVVRGLAVSEAEGGALRRRIALWRARPDFLACDVRDLPSRFAASRRSGGLPVLAWTVSTRALLERARPHADGFIVEAEAIPAITAFPGRPGRV